MIFSYGFKKLKTHFNEYSLRIVGHCWRPQQVSRIHSTGDTEQKIALRVKSHWDYTITKHLYKVLLFKKSLVSRITAAIDFIFVYYIQCTCIYRHNLKIDVIMTSSLHQSSRCVKVNLVFEAVNKTKPIEIWVPKLLTGKKEQKIASEVKFQRD